MVAFRYLMLDYSRVSLLAKFEKQLDDLMHRKVFQSSYYEVQAQMLALRPFTWAEQAEQAEQARGGSLVLSTPCSEDHRCGERSDLWETGWNMKDQESAGLGMFL